MTAAEIQSLLQEQKLKFREALARPADESTIPACLVSSQIASALFMGEIALQLAELNEKLTAPAIFSAFKEIQGKIDAEDPE